MHLWNSERYLGRRCDRKWAVGMARLLRSYEEKERKVNERHFPSLDLAEDGRRFWERGFARTGQH